MPTPDEAPSGATPAEPTASPAPAPAPAPAAPADPAALAASRQYVGLLVLGGLIGIPAAVMAFGFIQLVSVVQQALYQHLPHALGYATAPSWWAIPVLVPGGVLTGLAIRYLPGRGGHPPVDGFGAGVTPISHLPGILAAAVASLGFGAVLGPEAPLTALGAGLGAIAVRLARRDAPPMMLTVICAAGSFAAIATLFGSPIATAFFLMEVAGIGPGLSMVLLPGLVASGVGALVSVGMGSWTGLGVPTLAIPGLPPFSHPNLPELCWSVVAGLAAAAAGWAIKRLASALRPTADRWPIVAAPVVGVVVGVVALVFVVTTGKGLDAVLFSGQSYLAPLVSGAGSWTVGALALLVAGKALGYSLSMSSFRGGPIFPAILVGAAGGILMGHLPGFGMVPGLACGIAGMVVAMLRLPLSAVLLTSLLLSSDGVAIDPLIVITVAVAYVATIWLARVLPMTPAPTSGQTPSAGAGAAGAPAPATS